MFLPFTNEAQVQGAPTTTTRHVASLRTLSEGHQKEQQRRFMSPRVRTFNRCAGVPTTGSPHLSSAQENRSLPTPLRPVFPSRACLTLALGLSGITIVRRNSLFIIHNRHTHVEWDVDTVLSYNMCDNLWYCPRFFRNHPRIPHNSHGSSRIEYRVALGAFTCTPRMSWDTLSLPHCLIYKRME